MNHSYRLPICFASMLILVLSLTTLFAQNDPRLWETDGLAVKQGTHLVWKQEAARNSQGEICVVWSETRDGNRDIYAQLIYPDGSAAWQDEGIPLVTQTDRQETPVITAVEDGWIVAWIEWTDLEFPGFGPTYSAAVYAQKLDFDGNILWPDDGALVANIGISDPVELHIVPDLDRGALIAWTHWSQIQAQRIRRWGAIGWNEAASISSLVSYNTELCAVPDGQGNMIVAWNTIDEPYDPNIYAAKIMADGTLPWGEGENVIPICAAEGTQQDISICPDHTTGGLYCAWMHEEEINENDLYIQRIDSNGTALWETDGILLCDAPRSQSHVQLAANMNSEIQEGVLCVWADYRASGPNHEIYAQKVSAEGDLLWGEDGAYVCGNFFPGYSARENDVLIYSDLAGGSIICWNDNRNVEDYRFLYDLYAARLNENGANLWSACGELIADERSRQSADVMFLNEDAAVIDVVFINEQTGSKNIEHQRLALADGSILFETGDVLRTGLDGYVNSLRSISMSGDRVGLVWSDYLAGRYGSTVYYQIVNAGGDFELPQHGVLLAPDTAEVEYSLWGYSNPASDGNGGFFMAFINRSIDDCQLRLIKVNSNGDIACDPMGVLVFESLYDQGNPMICPDGSGGCYVAWSEYDSTWTRNLHTMHCDEDCIPTWAEPAIPIGIDSADHWMIELVPSSDCCILLCQKEVSNNQSNYVARICPDGSLDWSRLLCDAPLEQSDLCMIEDENNGVYISWTDDRSISSDAIFIQHIDSEGNDLWLHNGRRIVQEQAYGSQMVYSAENGLYLVWEDRRNSNRSDLYAQRIDDEGDPIWDSSGLAICAESDYQSNPKLLLNNLGGITCVWEDRRGFYSDIYGTDLLPDGTASQPWWIEGSGGKINTAYQSQLEPVLSAMGNYRVCVSWIDKRASGWTTYAREDDDESYFDLYSQLIETGTTSGAVDFDNLKPNKFALDQNYPNPFNPSTTISFTVPNTGQASLVVYDLLGRSVETLMDKQLSAGSYHVPWNAEALPSGVYFYRLTAGEFSDVKKTVLLK
ncbi:T9SS type A sorting domain-containing protein [bacterium]|nr:T9SS type A sorting domain-containing protein [bacterium]